MPTQHQRIAAAYTAETDRPRRRARAWTTLTRDLKPRDIIIAILALLGALGFVNPIHRIGTLETRVSGLEEQQRFTNYMLCVNARRTDPASAPLDCAPIIEARDHR